MNFIKYTVETGSKTQLIKAHVSDAGYDLNASTKNKRIYIDPGRWASIDTGLSIQLPLNIYGLIIPRSGLAINYGVTILNSPGLIDPGYRGIIKVILINMGSKRFYIKNGDRIAQVVFSRVTETCFNRTENIDMSTDRSDNCFGSSGTDPIIDL